METFLSQYQSDSEVVKGCVAMLRHLSESTCMIMQLVFYLVTSEEVDIATSDHYISLISFILSTYAKDALLSSLFPYLQVLISSSINLILFDNSIDSASCKKIVTPVHISLLSTILQENKIEYVIEELSSYIATMVLKNVSPQLFFTSDILCSLSNILQVAKNEEVKKIEAILRAFLAFSSQSRIMWTC